jgi:hypothetical protein
LPSKPLLAERAKRRIDRWKDPAAPVRYEWLKEFYRVRGDFSHGRLTTRQPMAWPNPFEHLTLAAIAFPLLVRCLLQRAGTYALTLGICACRCTVSIRGRLNLERHC